MVAGERALAAATLGPGRHGPGSFAGFGCLVLVLFFVLSYLVVLMIEAANFAAGTIGVLLFLAIFFGAAAIAIPRMMRRTGGVLDELRRATGRVEDGDYSVRVDVPTRAPRPVRDLVRGFDTMVERLEADERQRRSLLADVSHELRTPLAILRGNVEAILDGVHPADEEHLGALLEETKVIERLIEDLRTVALSEAGTLALHREPVDVGIIAADVATTFRGTASAASVEIALDVPDDVPLLDADPVRLREILGNLVDNAIRHTPPGGTVTIGVVADPRSQVIVLYRRRHWLGHRSGAPAAGVRPLRQRHVVTRLRPRAGDREGPHRGPRRDDRRRERAGPRDDDDGPAAAATRG